MSDQERIARLREGTWDHTVVRGPNPTGFCVDETPFIQETADRIEELVKERDDYKDLYYAGFKDAASLNIHYAEIGYKAKTAEAKFAKAVDAIKQSIQKWESPHYGDEGTKIDNAFDGFELLRKALAELEGDAKSG